LIAHRPRNVRPDPGRSVDRRRSFAADHLRDGTRAFLKLDTQGFERAVLEGGPATLAACRGLQLELSLTPLYEGGMLLDEAVALAYDAGFEMTSIGQGFTSPDGRMLQVDGVPDVAGNAAVTFSIAPTL